MSKPLSFEFESRCGYRIYSRHWKPEAPLGVVLLAHGLAEHGDRYDQFAQFFGNAGIALYAADHPGHGKSAGKRGHVNRFTEFSTVLGELHDIVKQTHPDIPLILFGHSMGGLVVADYLLRHQDQFAAAILTGAEIMPHRPPSGTLLRFVRWLARMAPRFGVRKLDSAGVSRDPLVVEKYDSDPLVHRGKISARLAAEMFTAMQRVQDRASEIELPLLIMHGGEDCMTAVQGSRFLHDRTSSPDKKLVIYDGLFHEILNEPERREVMQDILDWLEPRIDR